MSETIIGIVIGSFFTIIGVVVQGVITYFLEKKRRQEESKISRERSLTEKREVAYKRFMFFQSQLIVAQTLSRESRKNPQAQAAISSLQTPNNDAGQIIGCIIKQLTEILSDISLYGNWDTVLQCFVFFKRLNESHVWTDDDFTKLLSEYDGIVLKMRQEIGIPK